MEIKEFAGKVCSAVRNELGEGYSVELKEVRKNNDVVFHGMLILSESQNVAPTIYLNGFWEDYEMGTTFAETIRRLLAIYRKNMPSEKIDMSFFYSFEKVSDRICYRLIGRERNADLLRDIPHLEFLDLAICFYYAYRGEALGEGTIMIQNSHAQMWGVSTSDLLRLAQSNTPRLFPWVCDSLEEIFCESMGGRRAGSEGTGRAGETEGSEGIGAGEAGGKDGMSERPGETLRENSMRVLSNERRIHGAVCMIYPEVLEKLSGARRNFYILPSSVHEVILLGDTGWGDPGELKEMIAEVNSAHVAPEEVLSDNLYYYDSGAKKVSIL